jgi:hypothetical protein
LPVKTKAEWLEIRTEFEAGADGLSNKAFAAKHGVILGTLNGHRQRENWAPKGSITPEQIDMVDPAVDPAIAADLTESESPSAMAAELEKLRAELAQLKPVEVDWIIDIDSAARIMAGDIPNLIEDGLITFNRDRAKNNLAPFTMDEMEALQPGWTQLQRDRILAEAVSALSSEATRTGPSPKKIIVKDPQGNLKQILCEPGINNYDPSNHEQYILWHEERGFRRVTPQPCPRLDCWMPQKTEFDTYCTQLHYQLELAFRGKVHTGVTTTTSFATT